jgi:hypothetical protein
MPKLKFDLALARHDGIIYGIPNDGNERGRTFLLRGTDGLNLEPGTEELSYYQVVKQGTEVAVKFTLDEGTPPGFKRVVIRLGDDEIFTGDWALVR